MIIVDSLSDFELIGLLKSDSEKAFRIIYERYWDRIFSVAFHRLKDEADAEELVQDIFYNFWKRRSSFHLQKSLDNYFAVAVKFEVINRLAKQARASAYEQELAHSFTFIDLGTLEHLDYNDLQIQFKLVVNNLPEKCQIVFKLQHEFGYTHQQIADKLNISPKTVDAHLSKARKTLRGAFGNLLGLLL